MTEQTRIIVPQWGPFPPMLRAVEAMAAGKAAVLEIGPGHIPFGPATEFVDWQVFPQMAGRKVHALDINRDPLPFADKTFDFVYCRHTLEDIYNPFWVCREMSRVAKAGYIETPSPIAECCRGVDGGAPAWRGYIHHRYLIWNDGGTLVFLGKYPVIEYWNVAHFDAEMFQLLNESPLYWNTYFFWEDEIRFRYLQHDQDFQLQVNYAAKLQEGLQKALASARQTAARYLSG